MLHVQCEAVVGLGDVSGFGLPDKLEPEAIALTTTGDKVEPQMAVRAGQKLAELLPSSRSDFHGGFPL
ncbi:MAG: hypothetical protein Q6L50_07215 [Gloeomargarita sp. GMQP_bins_120]